MNKLKPCPFCGGEANIYASLYPESYGKFRVQCSLCHSSTNWKISRESAEDCWNSRVAQSNNDEFYLKAYQDLLEKSMDLNEFLMEKLYVRGDNNEAH